MSEEPISPTPTQMSLWADFPVSRSPMPATSEEPTTPDISGLKCSELSGNSGPLGLLERTLLGSRAWAWTKYSLIWRPRATPRGRLIFQLARLAPRTSASASGLLHTPTAKANQTSPSMETRGRGNWVSGLWPTPTAMTGGEDVAPSHLTGEHGWNTAAAVHSGLWPTPRGSGPTVVRSDGGIRDDMLNYAVEQFWPTPSSQEPGWKNIEVVDRYGNAPSHHNQRFYDKKTGRVVQKGLRQTVADPKSGGTLNPQWVAWLMGYPPEYFDSVPWETPSSRRSRPK
jgi:hypothetical protein